MKEMKAYWHIHHKELLGFSSNIQERIDYIKQEKSPGEIPLRLKLLKEVKGELPEEVVRAWVAYTRARVAYTRARVAYTRARGVYTRARGVYIATLDKHKTEIEALHAQECPNCPWDGKTIFPEKKEV